VRDVLTAELDDVGRVHALAGLERHERLGALAIVAGIGGFLSRFEHQDGWGAADRGLVAGFIYGVALLVAHAIAGTHAKVSLGSFPPLLAVVTAIFGMLLRKRVAVEERMLRKAARPAR